MTRVYNFAAGPAAIPEWVLKKAQNEMLDYHGSGMSVMEMSHRSSEFQDIIDTTEARLRRLMNIPEEYDVLFLQGGGSLQFLMVPLNLMKKKADVINTGQWTKKAIKETKKIGECNVVASSEEATFTYIPKIKQEDLSEDSDYVYICENNTIYGTKYKELPPHEGKLLVILKKELLDRADQDKLPSMLSYKVHADKGSMFNTPPTWAIYMVGLTCQWLEEVIGGLDKMQEINLKKANMLYDYIDQSKLYKNNVAKEDRSYMNVPFVTGDPELDKKFVAEAKEAGIVNIKGHRTVGGMRASIYNACTVEAVEYLINFMKKFEEENLK